MKVLFVSNDPSAFDPASATRARLREYATVIGELHFLSRAHDGAKEEQDGALFLHPIHAPKLFAPMQLQSRAHALILEKGIEVVSAQDPFEQGLAALKAVRGTQAKLHIQVHTDFLSPWFVRDGVFRSLRIKMPLLNRWRVGVAKKVLPHAAGIRAVSERVAKSIVVAYGDSVPTPSIIPIAVSPNVPAPVPLPPHGFSFAFMTSGRLAPEKRTEDILFALGKLGLHHQSVGLVVVGDGSEQEKLEKLAAKLGLSARVLFLGNRAADARGLMASAQCYVQASAYEGYSRTLVEAALAKIPIITTDVGIVGEVLKGYEDVLATPPGDTANLAAHMEAIIGDHQLRKTLAMNAEHSVRNHLAAYADAPKLIAEDLARAAAAR